MRYDMWDLTTNTRIAEGIGAEEAENRTRTTDIAAYVEEYGRCDTVDDDGHDICIVEAGSPMPGPFEEE